MAEEDKLNWNLINYCKNDIGDRVFDFLTINCPQPVRFNRTRELNFFEKRRNVCYESYVSIICHRERPFAMMTFQAWSAFMYEKLPHCTKKILDTVDVQHGRQKKALAAGSYLPGFTPPPTREDEIKLLEMSDLVVAVQEEEFQELTEMTPNTAVLLAEHSPEIDFMPSEPDSTTMLFVGNYYPPNIEGITDFVKTHWREIKENVPDAELIICGKVCEGLELSEDGVILKGLVPDLKPYYRQAAIVLSPLSYGTGLKIKSTEAMAYGKCLLATDEGVFGLHKDIYESAKVVDFADMGTACVNLLTSSDDRQYFEKQAVAFTNKHLLPDVIYKDFMEYLESIKEGNC